MNRKTNILVFTLILVANHLFAQDKKIDFYGAGRFNMINSSIEGNILNQDTTNPRRQQTGYALFDLGFHIRPNEFTEIKATTRVQNDLNGFWGAGINYQLRELYLRGLLFKKIAFQVGDLNTKMTPFTLYNFTEEAGENQVKALRLFQEINHYDKFYGDHSWRQQGAQANMAFDFKKYLNQISLSALITKNRQTDYFSIPDRLFSGLTIATKSFNHLHVNYQVAQTFDVKNTAMFSNTRYKNTVHTISMSDQYQLADWVMGLNLEMGKSFVDYTAYLNQIQTPEGNCMNGNLVFKNEKHKLSFELGMNYVSTSFRSMGSQTRRINWNQIPEQFPFYTNREIPRPAGLIEIMTDPGFLNTQLNPNLSYFDPQYENIRPYGMATPNRQGIAANISWKHPFQNWVELNLNYLNEKEITGQGTTALRKFNELKAYAKIHVNKLYAGKKHLNLELSYKNQQTNRTGNASIDGIELKSEFIKAGLNYVLFDQLELELATILFQAKGNEFIASRNTVNEIDFFTAYNTHLKEQIYVGGLNYQFGENTCLKFQYQQANRDNQLDLQKNYTLHRFAVIYNLFF